MSRDPDRAANETGSSRIHIGLVTIFYGLNLDSDPEPIGTMNIVPNQDLIKGSRTRT